MFQPGHSGLGVFPAKSLQVQSTALRKWYDNFKALPTVTKLMLNLLYLAVFKEHSNVTNFNLQVAISPKDMF